MKTALKFEARNAGDYLANVGFVCPETEAEFFAVTQEGDTLKNDIRGLVLTRKGRDYVQDTKMNHFRGVAFVEDTMYRQEAKTVTLKLIAA